MKRLLLLLGWLATVALAMVVYLALATPASADAGPHRGPVTGLPDFYAICHRVHSGVDAPLFRFSQGAYPTICEACHDGTGSNLDVRQGVAVYATAPNQGLRARGFVNVVQDPEADGTPTTYVTSSTHSRDATAQKPWGGGAGNVYYASSAGDLQTIPHLRQLLQPPRQH